MVGKARQTSMPSEFSNRPGLKPIQYGICSLPRPGVNGKINCGGLMSTCLVGWSCGEGLPVKPLEGMRGWVYEYVRLQTSFPERSCSRPITIMLSHPRWHGMPLSTFRFYSSHLQHAQCMYILHAADKLHWRISPTSQYPSGSAVASLFLAFRLGSSPPTQPSQSRATQFQPLRLPARYILRRHHVSDLYAPT